MNADYNVDDSLNPILLTRESSGTPLFINNNKIKYKKNLCDKGLR